MTWNRMFGHMSLAAAGQQGCWSCLHLLLAGLVLTLQHDILVCHNNSTRHVLVRVIQPTSWTRKRQNCKFDLRYHWYWTGPYWTSKDLVFLCIAMWTWAWILEFSEPQTHSKSREHWAWFLDRCLACFVAAPHHEDICTLRVRRFNR